MMCRLALFAFAALPVAAACGVADPSFDSPTIPHCGDKVTDASPRVERRKPLTANVGVVSVGLDTYWKQCPGLYEDMLKKAAVFEKRVSSHEVKVTSFGCFLWTW